MVIGSSMNWMADWPIRRMSVAYMIKREVLYVASVAEIELDGFARVLIFDLDRQVKLWIGSMVVLFLCQNH